MFGFHIIYILLALFILLMIVTFFVIFLLITRVIINRRQKKQIAFEKRKSGLIKCFDGVEECADYIIKSLK